MSLGCLRGVIKNLAQSVVGIFLVVAVGLCGAEKEASALRISTEDSCALSHLKEKALLHIQASRIECDAGSCHPLDSYFPISQEALSHGGVLVKTKLERAQLEKHLFQIQTEHASDLQSEMANLVISVSLCVNQEGKCGRQFAQLLRFRGNYFEALEEKGVVPIEFWVDPHSLASAKPSDCK